MSFYFISFFFKAEDGIRDHCVTGVQTCALPILTSNAVIKIITHITPEAIFFTGVALIIKLTKNIRSEERRIGKECKKRGSQCHYNRNHR